MKELYISPEVELIGFVAEERLAGSVNFDDMDEFITPGFNPESGTGPEGSENIIQLPFPGLSS